jgi:hypothetical protein
LVEFIEDVSGIGQVGTGFPRCIVFRVTNPFDKVLETVVAAARVKDVFDFIFNMVINGDRERGRDWIRVVRVRGRAHIWMEDGDVEDGVDM